MTEQPQTTRYPSGNPWPILQRLDADATGMEVHVSNYRIDALDAAHEIRRLRAVIRATALRWAPHLTHTKIDEVIHGKR